eukprot:GEMP01002385.1.p1 GENE.GEMP01002385.1~~GEMP01002385.1.p1  ORF type:complete len:1375 (+),score=190.25 GEMP01002385.1:60-4127(+)
MLMPLLFLRGIVADEPYAVHGFCMANGHPFTLNDVLASGIYDFELKIKGNGSAPNTSMTWKSMFSHIDDVGGIAYSTEDGQCSRQTTPLSCDKYSHCGFSATDHSVTKKRIHHAGGQFRIAISGNCNVDANMCNGDGQLPFSMYAEAHFHPVHLVKRGVTAPSGPLSERVEQPNGGFLGRTRTQKSSNRTKNFASTDTETMKSYGGERSYGNSGTVTPVPTSSNMTLSVAAFSAATQNEFAMWSMMESSGGGKPGASTSDPPSSNASTTATMTSSPVLVQKPIVTNNTFFDIRNMNGSQCTVDPDNSMCVRVRNRGSSEKCVVVIKSLPDDLRSDEFFVLFPTFFQTEVRHERLSLYRGNALVSRLTHNPVSGVNQTFEWPAVEGNRLHWTSDGSTEENGWTLCLEKKTLVTESTYLHIENMDGAQCTVDPSNSTCVHVVQSKGVKERCRVRVLRLPHRRLNFLIVPEYVEDLSSLGNRDLENSNKKDFERPVAVEDILSWRAKYNRGTGMTLCIRAVETENAFFTIQSEDGAHCTVDRTNSACVQLKPFRGNGQRCNVTIKSFPDGDHSSEKYAIFGGSYFQTREDDTLGLFRRNSPVQQLLVNEMDSTFGNFRWSVMKGDTFRWAAGSDRRNQGWEMCLYNQQVVENAFFSIQNKNGAQCTVNWENYACVEVNSKTFGANEQCSVNITRLPDHAHDQHVVLTRFPRYGRHESHFGTFNLYHGSALVRGLLENPARESFEWPVQVGDTLSWSSDDLLGREQPGWAVCLQAKSMTRRRKRSFFSIENRNGAKCTVTDVDSCVEVRNDGPNAECTVTLTSMLYRQSKTYNVLASKFFHISESSSLGLYRGNSLVAGLTLNPMRGMNTTFEWPVLHGDELRWAAHETGVASRSGGNGGWNVCLREKHRELENQFFRVRSYQKCEVDPRNSTCVQVRNYWHYDTCEVNILSLPPHGGDEYVVLAPSFFHTVGGTFSRLKLTRFDTLLRGAEPNPVTGGTNTDFEWSVQAGDKLEWDGGRNSGPGWTVCLQTRKVTSVNAYFQIQNMVGTKCTADPLRPTCVQLRDYGINENCTVEILRLPHPGFRAALKPSFFSTEITQDTLGLYRRNALVQDLGQNPVSGTGRTFEWNGVSVGDTLKWTSNSQHGGRGWTVCLHTTEDVTRNAVFSIENTSGAQCIVDQNISSCVKVKAYKNKAWQCNVNITSLPYHSSEEYVVFTPNYNHPQITLGLYRAEGELVRGLKLHNTRVQTFEWLALVKDRLQWTSRRLTGKGYTVCLQTKRCPSVNGVPFCPAPCPRSFSSCLRCLTSDGGRNTLCVSASQPSFDAACDVECAYCDWVRVEVNMGYKADTWAPECAIYF